MSDRVKDGTSETSTRKTAAEAIREKTEHARESVTKAYSKARDKTSSTYATARTRAAQGRERTTAALDENPVAALIGGLALGALVASLLPRGRREAELLSGVGERINQTSRRVADAARDSAREAIDGYGLSGDSAIEKVQSLLDTATKAASTIGSAAKGALKDR